MVTVLGTLAGLSFRIWFKHVFIYQYFSSIVGEVAPSFWARIFSNMPSELVLWTQLGCYNVSAALALAWLVSQVWLIQGGILISSLCAVICICAKVYLHICLQSPSF
jgi:hypothetical protein